MNRNSKLQMMICLLILLTLNVSCIQEESSEIKTNSLKINKPNLGFSVNDTNNKLKYTSGIRSILHDSKGNYWFGSHQEGVCLFDGETFTYFTVDDALSDNQVRTVQEDSDGVIWFGTANGVSSYSHENKNITNHSLLNILHTDNPSSNEWAKTDTDLWFSAGNLSGVYRYDSQKIKYLAFPKTKLVNSDNRYHSTGFAKGKNNQIWMATYPGVFGYNGKTFTIINDENLGLKDENGYLHIRSILEDSKGNLWIGNNGIGVLLNNGDTTINFSEKNGLIHFNSSRSGGPSPAGTLEHIFAIEEDKRGNIWFGDRDTGAWKYDGESMTNYIIDDKLQTRHIWEIYEDRNGELLFAMGDGGVYKFNGESFERKY